MPPYDSSIKCISPELSADLENADPREKAKSRVRSRTPSRQTSVGWTSSQRSPATRKLSSTPEFQTRYYQTMPVRMLAYYARILDRHRLPIYPVVVYLTETNAAIETTYNSQIGGRHVIAFNYDVIKVWELEPNTIFKNKLFGLYTLMRDADLAECNEKVIEAVEHNFISADSYTCMVTLARLKYSKEVVKKMIKDKLMRESPFYNDLVEDISAETRTKWIKEGMERGMEGSITTVLAARFGSVPDRLSGRVHSIRERGRDLLNELMKLAATVDDVGEFERKLDKMM